MNKTQTFVSLPARVRERARRLRLVAHAAARVFGGRTMELMDPDAVAEALRTLRAAVQSVPGAYLVIVGGLAVQEHGYIRSTEDVDALVDSTHFTEVLNVLRQSGFDLTTEHNLKHRATGIQVDLLREGAQLPGARSAIPPPQELGTNLGFASLSGLIRLKLIANRIEDQADVSRLLRAHSSEKAQIRAVLPPELLEDFDRIAK